MLEMSLAHLIEEFKNKGMLEGNAEELLNLKRTYGPTTLKFPGKIAFSANDNAFAAADSNHNQIITIDRTGHITRRIGKGSIGKHNGQFDKAEFYRPQGLCFHNGIIWVADTENHLIRKIDLSNETVTFCGWDRNARTGIARHSSRRKSCIKFSLGRQLSWQSIIFR